MDTAGRCLWLNPLCACLAESRAVAEKMSDDGEHLWVRDAVPTHLIEVHYAEKGLIQFSVRILKELKIRWGLVKLEILFRHRIRLRCGDCILDEAVPEGFKMFYWVLMLHVFFALLRLSPSQVIQNLTSLIGHLREQPRRFFGCAAPLLLNRCVRVVAFCGISP